MSLGVATAVGHFFLFLVVWPHGWGPGGWGTEGWGPRRVGAQNFALFFPAFGVVMVPFTMASWAW